MRRFALVFLGAIGVPVVGIGVLFTVGYQRFALSLAQSRAEQALAPLARGIDEEVRRASLLAATLSTDTLFVETVIGLGRSRDARERYEVSAQIDRRLSSFFNYTNKTGAVLLYLRDRPAYLYRNNGLLFERPLPKGEWYRHVIQRPDSTRIIADLDSYSLNPVPRPLLKVAVCPSDTAYRRGFEALVVAFRVPFLDEVAQSADRTGVEELLLVDDAGTVVLSGASDRFGTTVDPLLLEPRVFRRNGSTYVAHAERVPSAGWTLVSITDFSRVTRDLEILNRLARWVLLALVLAFAAYIEVFFRQVIRPIRTVIRVMGRVEKGDWSGRVPAGGPAEIAQLAASFNTMVAELSALTAERERQERERAHLELEALRLQINPHFLTNTLNSIKMMAALSNAEPIRRMTAALMRVVSSAFREGQRPATVGEELDLLAEYLLIMRVRYGDTFDMVQDVAPEHRDLRIPRMLLQPLVENSILHGFQGLDRRGQIEIRSLVERDKVGRETLILEIADNGCGADRKRVNEALARPLDPTGHPASIGLANIVRRITLNHGTEYGLVVLRPVVGGTTVRVRLPVTRGG